jgi:hypothetical protein
MNINFQRLFSTDIGRGIVSILLGLGLATMFRQACNGRDCLIFHGPIISEIDGKIFKHNDKCYKYTASSTTCNKSKKIIDVE